MIQINQWVEEALTGKKRLVIPIMTHPGIELCGRTVKDAVTNGEIHAEAIIGLNNKYPADGVTAIMDLTVEAEAFGAKIIFPEDEVPSVTERLVSSHETVESLIIPSLETARVPQYLKANRLSAEAIRNKPVLAGCIGPFSLAGRLFDLSEMMMALYMEPETITLLLDKCTTFLTAYCKAIKETGVNGIVMAEPAAGLVSNEDCYRFSTSYVRRIVEELQDDNFIIILHNCGNGGHCTDAMVRSGARGLHFGNKINMIQALKDSPENILIMGNLDPVGLFKQSTAEEVHNETRDLLTETTEWKNFILSTGCDIPPHIPFENIEAFYRTVEEYNS